MLQEFTKNMRNKYFKAKLGSQVLYCSLSWGQLNYWKYEY